MKHGVLPRALLAAALLLAPLPAFAQAAVPALKARVTDLTSTLTAEQRAALEQKLASLEAQKGSQVAVLLVPTTQPEAIEPFATRVFEAWKLGRSRVDDGVLLVVAKNDRKLRIEVGYGLEGAIPDAIARRIIDEDITPRFKQGDFYGGLNAGVERIARLVSGEKLPPPAADRAPAARDSGWPDWSVDLIIGIFFGLLALAGWLQSVLGRLPGAAVFAAGIGFIVWVIAGLGFALAVGIVAFVVSLILGPSTVISFLSSGGGGSRGGGWSSGGGGGGYSGGGGSSGGGGASGSW